MALEHPAGQHSPLTAWGLLSPTPALAFSPTSGLALLQLPVQPTAVLLVLVQATQPLLQQLHHQAPQLLQALAHPLLAATVRAGNLQPVQEVDPLARDLTAVENGKSMVKPNMATNVETLLRERPGHVTWMQSNRSLLVGPLHSAVASVGGLSPAQVVETLLPQLVVVAAPLTPVGLVATILHPLGLVAILLPPVGLAAVLLYPVGLAATHLPQVVVATPLLLEGWAVSPLHEMERVASLLGSQHSHACCVAPSSKSYLMPLHASPLVLRLAHITTM